MKPRVALVTIGHVDHVKSTLLGRLLTEKGVVPREEVARDERQGALTGKSWFKYAWVMDRSEESHAHGLTPDFAYADFATRNRKVHLIDAPGHQDFVRSMISGTTGAVAGMPGANPLTKIPRRADRAAPPAGQPPQGLCHMATL